MNIMELGAIGELVGGAAVLATLVYLAMQVRQSTSQSEQNAVISAARVFPVQLCALTESEENAAVLRSGLQDFNALTPNQAACFNSLLLGLFSALANVIDVHKAGLIPIDEFEAAEACFVQFITTPGGREWWEQTKHIYPTRLVIITDAAVATRQRGPITESWRFLAPEEA